MFQVQPNINTNCRPKWKQVTLLRHALGQPQSHQEAAFTLAPSMLTHTPIGLAEKSSASSGIVFGY